MKEQEENEALTNEKHGSGAIYNMIGWLATNQKTVYLFTVVLFIVGMVIYNILPKEQFPDIKVPQIYVQTIYAGTTPGDIENTITKPIEKQIKTIAGVKKVKSNSLQDFSIILVEFNPDVKVDDALRKVKDKVDIVELPKDLTKKPVVQDVNFSEFPIMNINLAGNFPLAKLKDFAEDLQDEIEGLPEITRVDIVGALTREIQINLDLYKAQVAGLTFSDVQMAIQGENVNISGGELSVEGVRRTLRVKGEFKSMDQIQNIRLRSSLGAMVRLGDVAEVIDSSEEQQDFARLNNKKVVTLNVIKRGGANLIAASEKIEEIIAKAKENRLPQGLEIKITADSSERTKGDINDLVNTVILGFIFVVLVLMFFMGVRDAIFVGLSVPLSALLAFIPLYFMGFTLNTIVLFAFLLGLGIVVDDAIVVIENSHRIFNRYRHISIVDAVKLAASEVFIPVLSGTTTTIMPFVPLLFWPGIVGEFMKFLPITLICTLIASLIVAYVMNPVFAVSFMKRHDENEHVDTSVQSLKKPAIILAVCALLGYIVNFGLGNFFVLILALYVFNHFILTPKIIIPFQEKSLPAFKNNYQKLISWVITGYRPVFAVIGMVVLLVVTFVLMGIVQPKVIFFPSGDPDYIYIYNNMPVGTDARVTDSVTKVIEKKVFEVLKREKAEGMVNSVISNVGKNAGDPTNPDRAPTPQKSKVTVAFVSKVNRGGISSEVILDKVRKEIKALPLPGSIISVDRENNGPPTGAPIAIEIAGDDFKELAKLEKRVLSAIDKSGIKGIEELKSDLITNKPEIIIDVDKEKAQREGISSAQVAMAVRTALFGTEISKFRDDKDEYPIQLRVKSEDRNQIEKLLSLNITYRDMVMGGVLRQVPLNSIATISYSTSFSQINRKNQERLVTLSSNVVQGYNANEIVAEIQELIDDMDVPSGYTLRMGGEQEDQKETGTFLAGALVSAVLLIFLVLVMQFNSISKPIIIFVTILLSFIGVLLGFMAFGQTFSIIMSGVGIIALAGIVVKNGILLIEFTDELVHRGYPLKKAIVEAGSTRLTPVILTAAAAVLGLVPLAIGLSIDFVAMFTELNPHIHTGSDSAAFWNILAWTIIYGLTFSTILTLVIVPCMYYINERIRQKYFGKPVVQEV
ncbi:multidrug efflux pump subunit AcrB [Arcicella sp. BE140]|nr:multidrug efflux pump subunit AcrB [Arcicella sp. BE51]MDR6813227.1 multidrug efflux pump subunit AcrB [Arcicella sp. BE140]MDR6824541.1 multidrug efflux pump subunit AcrB [Arcicella sp. BE139]